MKRWESGEERRVNSDLALSRWAGLPWVKQGEPGAGRGNKQTSFGVSEQESGKLCIRAFFFIL